MTWTDVAIYLAVFIALTAFLLLSVGCRLAAYL